MRDMGIYIQEEKVFYYLEAGDNYIGNTLIESKKLLSKEGLLRLFLETLLILVIES